MKWTLVYTKQARRDARKLAQAGLKPQAERPLEILAKNPNRSPPRYEKLVGQFTGACSRRINIQHRLVYQIMAEIQTVKVLRMWSHYE